ncbi:DUF3560 domain-containing protein [Micromonospora sp. NPDC050397]|uniref:DUF3560 domain-containing protein n=1 Tax=Micromonospora sp. NPDC050397 TaxID=3364279 RepID=UPI003850DC16
MGIYIRGSRDRDVQRWRIDAAAQALRDNGFDVEIEVDDQWRPTADREADRAVRADERADRLHERAGAAASRRDARQHAADRVYEAIPFGQPEMPGHHSYAADHNRRERARTNVNKAIKEDRYAGDLAERANAVRVHEDAKDNPRAIMRRLERLRADLRRWERERVAAAEADTSAGYQARVQREIDRLAEDIAHQEAKLADRAASGEFVAWGPDNLAKDDLVQVRSYGWYRVTRVNRKTVSLDNPMWPQKAPFDEIFGRRRDGLQYDTPHGQPWPVHLATAVERWQRLEHGARIAGYDPADQTRARHVRWAQRLVHGLDLSASDAEVTAFWPGTADPETVSESRRLSAAYLAVFDRLEAGELVPDIVASLLADRRAPSWRLPDGDPVDRHPQDLHPGDLVKGVWQYSGGRRELWRYFAGPVTAVGPVEHRRELGNWVSVALTDSPPREFQTHQWLAVFPGRTPEPPAVVSAAAGPGVDESVRDSGL